MNDDSYQISRRHFLRYGTCGAMGIGSLVNTVSQLQLINSAAAATVGGSDVVGSDYKALVCIFLRGGCDMNNVLIPVAGNPQAAGYASDRGIVGIPNGVADPLGNPSGANNTIPLTGLTDPFGLHPSCTNLANMFNAGEASFLTNVGTLGEPTTPSTYSTASLPRQLFSHSDQVTEWMSSIADQPYTSGWGARVADLYHANWNPDSATSMLITAAGNNQFLNGSPTVPQYSVTSSGAVSLAGFGTGYSNALDSNGDYINNTSGRRLKALERIMAYSHNNLIEDSYATIVKRARESEAVITEASNVATSLGLDLDTVFSSYGADSNIAEELKSVARLIAGRKCLGNKRQIFFVDLGGFDNHQSINDSLPGLLTNVDNAIGAFNQAMKDLATLDTDFEYDNVTTFQASDFNRTWTPNGTDSGSAGTDHAWGTHSFIFGGAVNGGEFFGSFPELAVGGSVDVPSGSRGRWIPTTSVDEYCAILSNWFGVPAGSSEMEAIFPNLPRFNDPFAPGSNIAFL
ncbi:MAG: DUF1501 domain-containing protein [Verrucomicrobiota bacterium]